MRETYISVRICLLGTIASISYSLLMLADGYVSTSVICLIFIRKLQQANVFVWYLFGCLICLMTKQTYHMIKCLFGPCVCLFRPPKKSMLILIVDDKACL